MKRVKNNFGSCMHCKYCEVDKWTYNIFIVHCSKDNNPVTKDEFNYDHECRNGKYRRHTKHKAYANHPWKNYAETYRQKD
jgi:hypothetical protein